MRRQPRSSSNRDTGFFAPERPRILAHRGLALEAPENTMMAFLAALSLGVDYLETDVHASHDGVAVVSHDEDLRRLAGRDVRVDQLAMSELRRVQLGSGQSFCSLAEALDGFPDARFNIDLKSDAAVGPTVKAIVDARAQDRVLLASFDNKRRLSAVGQVPGVATSASRRGSVAAVAAARLGLPRLVSSALDGVDAVQLPLTARGVQVVTQKLVSLVHAAGVEVHVWTVNDVDEMARLLELGVDGIVTDRADLAMGLIRG